MYQSKKSPAPAKNEQSTELINLKTATDAELMQYFKKVIELKNTGEKFPVKLDEVWPLVYSRKDPAIRALKNNTDFIEGYDYQLLHQNVEQDLAKKTHGGHNREDYELSLACMEFFIARKVRRVFEVYRQVFHNSTTKKRGVKLYDHEKPLFEILDNWLVQGDMTAVAQKLGVRPASVSRVKRGIFRSRRIMRALLDQCRHNRDMQRTNGYTRQMAQLEFNFFTPPKTLAQ